MFFASLKTHSLGFFTNFAMLANNKPLNLVWLSDSTSANCAS